MRVAEPKISRCRFSSRRLRRAFDRGQKAFVQTPDPNRDSRPRRSEKRDHCDEQPANTGQISSSG